MSLLHTFYTNSLAFVSSICIHLISCTFAVHFSKLETLASLVTGRLAPDWESHCRFLGNVIFDNWNCMCSFLWLGSSFFKVGLKRWGCTGLKNGSRLAEHHVCRWKNAKSLHMAGWTLLQVAPCPFFGNIPNLLVAKSIQVVFLGQTQFCHWNWQMEPTDFQPPTSRTSGAPPRVKAIVLRQALMAWHVSGSTWSLTITLTSGLMIKTRDITWKSLRACYRPHWPMMRLVRAASTLWQQVLCHTWSY